METIHLRKTKKFETEWDHLKLMTFLHQGIEKFGIVHHDEKSIIDIFTFSKDKGIPSPTSLIEGIKTGNEFLQTLHWILDQPREERDNYSIPFSEIQWLSPIPQPQKNIMCVGKNYREHVLEMGSEEDIPEHIMIFTKAPTTVIGHKEAILSHQEVTKELDYEGELAVIIGKKGTNIKKEEALDYVFGYTILNDITARDLQRRHKQFFLGKSLDGFCPVGPWIVTKDEIPFPNNLDIKTRVNGEIRQDSNTKHMIFPIEEFISVLSEGMTLEPGDIIATGTPEGVGKGFQPPRFLQPGDKIEIEIGNIGKLVNIVK